MVSVCLPSDALLQHLPSYLGFSYLGRGVSLHGCSSKAQPLLLNLDEGYLLTIHHCSWPSTWNSSSRPSCACAGTTPRVAPPGRWPWPRAWVAPPNKQGDNRQPWCSPFPIWKWSVVSCPVPCCFLTCIQIFQEAGKVVWYSHLFKNFPQFNVIYTVKGFGIINKAEVDVFLVFSCIFDDPMDVGNLISSSSAFLNPARTSGSSWFMYCWSLAWKILISTLLACEMIAIVW